MITELFLRIYATQGGVITRMLTSLAIAAIAAVLGRMSLSLDAQTTAELTATVGMAIATLLSETVNHLKTKSASKTQEIINQVTSSVVPAVERDGLIHNETINALETMAATVNVLTANMTSDQVRQLKGEVSNTKL